MLVQEEEEAMEVGCCGYGGTDAECLLVVWYAADGGSVIQLIGAYSIVLRRLDGGGAVTGAVKSGDGW